MEPIERRIRKLESANRDSTARIIVVATHDDDDDAEGAFERAGITPTERDLVIQVLSFGPKDQTHEPRVMLIKPL